MLIDRITKKESRCLYKCVGKSNIQRSCQASHRSLWLCFEHSVNTPGSPLHLKFLRGIADSGVEPGYVQVFVEIEWVVVGRGVAGIAAAAGMPVAAEMSVAADMPVAADIPVAAVAVVGPVDGTQRHFETVVGDIAKSVS